MYRIVILCFSLLAFLLGAPRVSAQVVDSSQSQPSPKMIPLSNDNDEVFIVVEQQPEFPGGKRGLKKYLTKNVHYPQTAQGISGKVFVSFVIEKDGSVSNIKVVRGIGGGCDEEVVRAVQDMPHWKPGTQRGKPVRFQYVLPVEFTLR